MYPTLLVVANSNSCGKEGENHSQLIKLPDKQMNIKAQIKRIKNAYNKTVNNYFKGVNESDLLPHDFKESKEFHEFENGSEERIDLDYKYHNDILK